MKRASPAPPHLLQVYPMGGRLPEGTPVDLNLTRGDLIKHEASTLIWRTVLADGRQISVKMYKRSLLAWCGHMVISSRAQREFNGLNQLEKLGIPCSRPLFWCRGHVGPYGWAEILVTEWVSESQSLRDMLKTRPEAYRSLDLSPLFADIAIMHGAGLLHGTLTTKNILFKGYPESPTFVFIDMPRFHRFPRDIRGTRMARYDLMCLCERLFRSFPEDKVSLWLSAYGIPESDKDDFLIRLKQFRLTGFLRRSYGTEFNVRSGMTKFVTFRRRTLPETDQPSGRRPPINKPHPFSES